MCTLFCTAVFTNYYLRKVSKLSTWLTLKSKVKDPDCKDSSNLSVNSVRRTLWWTQQRTPSNRGLSAGLSGDSSSVKTPQKARHTFKQMNRSPDHMHVVESKSTFFLSKPYRYPIRPEEPVNHSKLTGMRCLVNCLYTMWNFAPLFTHWNYIPPAEAVANQ